MSDELFFLIAKCLEDSPCQGALEILKNELVTHKLLPPRIDWQGGQHQQTYEELKRKYPHISSNHLLEICQGVGPLLERESPKGVQGITSLLRNKHLSLVRSSSHGQTSRLQLYDLLGQNRFFRNVRNGTCFSNVNLLRSAELLGRMPKNELVPVSFYSKLRLCSRNLGHLSAVYCVLFDRTGKFVFTGADDLLVKVWSAEDGRLLSTFRGASSEIADLAVSFDNRLLAAGSCDKIVRVWCLRTGAPVAVLTGHSGMITSINFCPSTRGSVRYLASTSSDGSASFWEYYYPSTQEMPRFLPRPHKFCERMRPGHCQMLCTSFSPGGMFMAAGCADHHVRVYFMHGKEGPERILEVEAHVDRVDSIQWAGRGLKFISGSKDGTALIWSFQNQQWNSVRLKMNTQLPGMSDPEDENRLNRLRVSMVAWVANDTQVVTAASDFTLKVWDETTGNLINVLRGHEDEAFVLEPHPTDHRILLSAGHDGKVIVWDLINFESLKIFTNFIEGQGHGAVYDAKWSSDGWTIAATDSHGHICIFGFGEGKAYEKVPKQLFFHTDYRPLIRDANHHVLDEQTQLAPHLMPPPFIVDSEGNPYPPEVQRLVPGREHCTDNQLVPQVVLINGEEEIIEAPIQNEDSNQAEPGSMIDQMINRLAIQSDRRRSESRSEGDQPDGQASGEGTLNQSFQPALRPWIKRNIARPLDKSALEASITFRTTHGEEEITTYRRHCRSPSRRLHPDSPFRPNSRNQHEVRIDAHVPRRRMRVRTPEPQGSRQSQARATPGSGGRVPRRPRGARATDDLQELDSRRRGVTRQIMQDDEDSRDTVTRQSGRLATQRRRRVVRSQPVSEESSQEETQQETQEDDPPPESGGSDSSNESESEESSSGSESSDYSDWMAETGTSLQPPKRITVERKKRPRKVRRIVSDDDEQEHQPEETEATAASGSARHRRRRRVVADLSMDTSMLAQSSSSQPRVVAGSSGPSVDEGEKRTRRRGPQKQERPQRQAARNAAAAVAEDAANGGQGEGSRPTPAVEPFFPSDWLSESRPLRSPYHPQMGDEVMYFRQGHEIYARYVRQNNCYDLNNRSLPWMRMQIREQELVRVIGIKYEVRPPRLCCLKLAILDPGTGEIGGTFSVKYHDVKDVLDFLVLKQTYYAAVAREWKPGDRYRCAIEERWYEGTIIAHQPYEADYPDSMFLCYKVRWDDGTEDQTSPWDIERVDPNRHPSDPTSGLELLPHEFLDDLYEPDPSEWSGFDRDTECDRIADLIGQMMTLSAAEPFLTPVDLTAYPDYAEVVPYSIDISLIKRRVENRFYRRKASLQFDVRFVAMNAAKYNEPRSRIVKTANIITDLLLEIIQNVNCPESTAVYHQLVEDYKNRDHKSKLVHSDMGEGTSKAAPKLKMVEEHLDRPKLEPQSRYKWKAKCQQLLNRMWSNSDAEPFKAPVNLAAYPDYLEVVPEPMDLSTVRQKLGNDEYQSPADFNAETRRIFSNSRLYNQNTKSRIYSMTIRLSSLFENHMKEILQEWRASLSSEERVHIPARSITRSGAKILSPHKTRAATAAAAVDVESPPPTLEPENPAVRREWRRLQTTMLDRPARDREEEGARAFSRAPGEAVESFSSPFTFRGRRDANATSNEAARGGYTLRANRDQRWRHLLDDRESSASPVVQPATRRVGNGYEALLSDEPSGSSRTNNIGSAAARKRARIGSTPEDSDEEEITAPPPGKRSRKTVKSSLESRDNSESEVPLSRRGKKPRRDATQPSYPSSDNSEDSEDDSKKASLRRKVGSKAKKVLPCDNGAEKPPKRNTRGSRAASPESSDEERKPRLRLRNEKREKTKDADGDSDSSLVGRRRGLKYEHDSDFEASFSVDEVKPSRLKRTARSKTDERSANGNSRPKRTNGESSRLKMTNVESDSSESESESEEKANGNETDSDSESESEPVEPVVKRSTRRRRPSSRLCAYDSDGYNRKRKKRRGSNDEGSRVTVSSRGRLRKPTARSMGLSD